MGMAASQARFLGLTARKSNVEYQGQQVNQQRTSLANESAGMYNQMMELEVPVPPTENDYYKTVYTLENSELNGSDATYSILNYSKANDGTGEYNVALEVEREERKAKAERYKWNSVTHSDAANTDGFYSAKINMQREGLNKTFDLICEYKKNDGKVDFSSIEYTNYVKDDQLTNRELARNKIYALPPMRDDALAVTNGGVDTEKAAYLEGFEEAYALDNTIKYVYQDDDGKMHYLSQTDLEEILNVNADGTMLTNDNNVDNDRLESGAIVAFTDTYTKPTTYVQNVRATLEEAQSGRLTSIKIASKSEYGELSGQDCALSMTRELDEEAHKQAYNDYEYEKYLYEKAISDINAQTEKIQAKDQSLELKIQQLDTEQNAIQTEMDSVTKVIEDNVEKTFNIFG